MLNLITQSDATIPVPWVASAVAAALTIGIAWGALAFRVRALEVWLKKLDHSIDKLMDEVAKLRDALGRRS